MKKKIIIMKKNEKKVQKNCWATAQIVLQYNNTVHCIVREREQGCRNVLQYKNCIVTKGARLLDCVATQGRDMAS